MKKKTVLGIICAMWLFYALLFIGAINTPMWQLLILGLIAFGEVFGIITILLLA